MKKSILIFGLGLTTMGFISCGGNNSSEGEYTQEQLDSVKLATEDSIQRALEAQQDSLLLEEALEHSQSNKGSSTPAQKPTTKPAQPTTPPSETQSGSALEEVPETPAKPGGLRGKSDQAKQDEAQSGGGGLRSKSDQAKQQEAQSGGGGLRSKSDQAKQQGN